MVDLKARRREFEGIRDERRTAANTAVRIGNAFLSLLDVLENLGLDDKYLSKVSDDAAEGVITFLKGLLVGNGTYGIGMDGAAQLLSIVFDTVLSGKDARRGFTDGRGIYMDAEQGLIQTDGLEVRGFMRIMELIINRLQLMESDYSFTEGGEIEHVDYTNDGRLILHMHKRHDNDITPFYEGDILYAEINDLLPPGTVPAGHTATKHGSYFTSWMRVDSVDQAENTLTVSLYQSQTAGGDPIVPGGRNFTPYGTPIMGTDLPSVALNSEKVIVTGEHILEETGFDCSINVTRHGNVASSPDAQVRELQRQRQQSWVLSTTDQRLAYYWRVDQPIIRDDNYALCLGILPNLANLPSTRDPEMPSLYINTIFYENSHHIYYPSRIVKEDRGEWTQNPTAEYTGPSGTYTPDGTLSQADQQMVGSGGTFTSGQMISEPYHCEGVTRNTWLTCRLSPAWSNLTDNQLLGKIRVEWHLDLETSRVWRYGSLWECRTEGTAEEPWLTSTGWLCLNSGSVTLRIAVSKRFLRQSDITGGRVATTLSFVLTIGGTDITSRVTAGMAVWTRQSSGADSEAAQGTEARALYEADVIWNTAHRYGNLSLPITANDLPSNWNTAKEVQFTLTVTIGGETRSRAIRVH